MNNNLNSNPLGNNSSVETLDFVPNTPEAIASNVQPSIETQQPILSNSPETSPEPLIPNPQASISQPVNDSDFEYHKPKKKINLKMILLIVILLAVLGVGGFFGYKILSTSPYSIYQKVINELFAVGRPYLEQEVSDINLTYSGNVKVETNIEGMEDFNDYSYNYLLGVDTQNKKAEVMLGLNEKDKTILDLFVYLLNGKGYLKSDALTDYLLDGGNAELEFDSPESNTEDALYLYNKIESMLLGAFVKEDFQNKSATIKVDGKQVKVKDNYLNVTPNVLDKAVDRMINILKSDSKTVEILANYMEYTVEDVNSMLDEITNTDFTTVEINMVVHFYTSGLFNKISGFSLEVADEQIVYAGFDGDIISFTISAENEVLASGKITKISDNETKYEVNIGELTINLNVNSKVENNNLSTQIVEVEVFSGETNLKVTIDNKVEKNKEIANIDTSKAKDANELSDSEKEEILDKLTSIIESTAFYPYLELLFSSYDDYYSDSYFDENYYDDEYSNNNLGDSLDEYNPACDYAVCDDCNGDSCKCEYYDNNFELQTITCPNKMYY